MVHKRNLLISLIFGMIFLTSCGGDNASTEVKAPVTQSLAEVRAGEYDSSDVSIVTSISSIKNTITFYNFELQKYYTLSVDSLTDFYDKYGNAITFGQLEEGKIVEINFLKSRKNLVTLKLSKDAFEISDVHDFSINTGAKIFDYKTESYKITSGTIVLSGYGGVLLSELDGEDYVKITGFDNTIYAITLDKGHGSLKFKGTDKLEGGNVKVGYATGETLSKDLEIPLGEGEYEVTITKGKTTYAENVKIEAFKETLLDLSGVVLEEEKTGKVLFGVTPTDAAVYVDGELIDASTLITLKYGRHQVLALRDGYESVSKYFNVGKEQATLLLSLESTLSEEETETEAKEEDYTDGYYIFITDPSDVEVTWDGIYVGKTPLSLKKEAGTHTLKISRTGYVSRSYTVSIENTAKDVYYAFDALAAESTTTSTATSASTEASTTEATTDSTNASTEVTSTETTSTKSSASTGE